MALGGASGFWLAEPHTGSSENASRQETELCHLGISQQWWVTTSVKANKSNNAAHDSD